MRRTSPALEAQVAAALAAGWPIVAIAEQTGISLSTVKRIRGRSGVRPDSMREELIEEARAGLRASLSSEFAASEGAQGGSILCWLFNQRIVVSGHRLHFVTKSTPRQPSC